MASGKLSMERIWGILFLPIHKVEEASLTLILHSEKPLHQRTFSSLTTVLPGGRKEVVITDVTTGKEVNKSIYKPYEHE